MSTNRPPAGRQPQSVYIRRRLTVLGVLVVIIVVIILIVARPGSGKPTATNTHTPTAGHTTSAKVPTCKDSNIQVIGVTDATSYAAGVDPMISLSITNTGPSDCSFNVGTNAQKYVITSGTDLIWQSTDCQTDAKSLVVTLKPGVTQKTTPFAWKRVRSNPSACSATNPPQVTAKGASYHLTVTVNGVTSTTANSPQFILR